MLQKINHILKLSQAGEKLKKHPYAGKKAATTVTFIGADLSSAGIYKMVYPALALNEYSLSHRAFLPGLRTFNPADNVNELDFLITGDIIDKSDWIVFPMVTYDLSGIVGEIKKVKPEMKFAYCVDLNFMDVPTGYPNYKNYQSNQQKANIIENMKTCDVFLHASFNLGAYIYTTLQDKLAGRAIEFEMPVGFFPGMYKDLNVENLPNVENDQLRLGIICNPEHFEDLSCVRKEWIEIKEKYGKEVQFIAFGWDGKMNTGKGFRDVFRGLDVQYVKPVSFSKYLQTIVNLQFDAVLLPVKKTDFATTSKNYSKVIELGAMGIPVIATASEPYKDTLIDPFRNLIKSHRNGILIDKKEDWMKEIELILNDSKEIVGPEEQYKLDEYAAKIMVDVQENFPYNNPKILKRLTNIFAKS